MSFKEESHEILRRFIVRCDHLQGLTVDDLRMHFEQVFRLKRETASSEDESDQITHAETLYHRVLVHLVYHLYKDLRHTNLDLGSINVGVFADSRNDSNLRELNRNIKHSSRLTRDFVHRLRCPPRNTGEIPSVSDGLPTNMTGLIDLIASDATTLRNLRKHARTHSCHP